MLTLPGSRGAVGWGETVISVVAGQQRVAMGRAAWWSAGAGITRGGATRQPTWLPVLSEAAQTAAQWPGVMPSKEPDDRCQLLQPLLLTYCEHRISRVTEVTVATGRVDTPDLQVDTAGPSRGLMPTLAHLPCFPPPGAGLRPVLASTPCRPWLCPDLTTSSTPPADPKPLNRGHPPARGHMGPRADLDAPLRSLQAWPGSHGSHGVPGAVQAGPQTHSLREQPPAQPLPSSKPAAPNAGSGRPSGF